MERRGVDRIDDARPRVLSGVRCVYVLMSKQRCVDLPRLFFSLHVYSTMIKAAIGTNIQ